MTSFFNFPFKSTIKYMHVYDEYLAKIQLVLLRSMINTST